MSAVLVDPPNLDSQRLAAAQNLVSIAQRVLHYERALSKASGEHFNIFNILHIAHYEVRTHSPILAELLNPKGTHGQGAVFLSHFCQQLGIGNFDANSGYVQVEYTIGRRTDEEGGRIDIMISDKNDRQIIIENKIYAGEQWNQLQRYKTYAPDAQHIFLTLNGERPHDQTAAAHNLKCVSYRSDIVQWLYECRKEAAEAPSVRETITQYIHLIQKLTHQNTNSHMAQELSKTVLQNEESYLAYIALRDAERQIHNTILTTLDGKLRSIAGDLGLVLNDPIQDMSKTYSGFSLSSPLLQKHGLKISFEFGLSDYRDLYFGFPNLRDIKPTDAARSVKQFFEKEFGPSKSNDVWLVYRYADRFRNWDEEIFAAIQFGNFAADLRALITRLASVAKLACKAGGVPNELSNIS